MCLNIIMSKIRRQRMGIRLGFETAYIDGSVASSLAYRPQFVSNNYKEGKKVLSSIEDELLKCDQFQISVGYLIAISRSRVSSPFNTYLGEAIALLFMILLIFLICLAPVDISVCVKKIWFISGTVKALFVFLEMKNSFDTDGKRGDI